MARRAALIFGFSLVVLWAAWSKQHFQTTQATTAQLDILDVGQGDAIHLRALTGTDMLIDGGVDNMVIERLGEVMPFWDRRIEIMVSTHPDADHITGLITVFDYYTVDQLVIVDLPLLKSLRTELLQRAAAQGTEILYLSAGDSIQLSDRERIDIIYPLPTTPVAELSTNDTSYFMLYTFAGTTEASTTSFLTSGDASDAVEKQLVNVGMIPDIDILKAGHHGSKTSSSAEYVAAAQPEVSVISVGADNNYGHPTVEALEHLQSTSQIFRTDQLGTISFLINETGYTYQPNTSY